MQNVENNIKMLFCVKDRLIEFELIEIDADNFLMYLLV